MASNIKRQVKIITKQHVLANRDSGVEGFPLRAWTIELWLLNDKGEEIPADIFSKVQYNLHESFGPRAKQVLTSPPFKVSEEGWGEFDMQITVTAKEKGGDHHILHDLNFQNDVYEHKEAITFKNAKPGLIELLRDSGPVPGEAPKKDAAPKKKKSNKGVNMEELAESLQRLNEDDLLHVVQMIHDGKNGESYTKNDVEAGEFHVDLYTLPDDLITNLWTFTEGRTN